MKILFVCSGNSGKFNVAPFIQSQGNSLLKKGIDVRCFTIQNKGIWGYMKAAKQLHTYLKKDKFDLIHAHYTLSGWTAVLSFSKLPIVLSLMGSDAYGDYIGHNKITFKSRFSIFLTYMIQPFVEKIICKSEHIQSFVLNKRKSTVIPNGVLLEDIPLSPYGFRDELGLSMNKQYLLFLGDKKDRRKNYKLVQNAVEKIKNLDVEVITPYPVNHETALQYMQSVDVLIVPSFMEGSPNVIKEAMACNCPVVATKVGDVVWLFGKKPGHFITDFTVDDCALKIEQALQFSQQQGRTNGRQQIVDLGLEASVVAEKIMALYREII